MDEKVYFLAKEISEELSKDERVILLNKLDKELNDSIEVYHLSNLKDEALEKYAYNKELYGDESEITKKSLLELQKAKIELNNHPLVKEYLKAYSEVRNLNIQINNILLEEYKGGECR